MIRLHARTWGGAALGGGGACTFPAVLASALLASGWTPAVLAEDDRDAAPPPLRQMQSRIKGLLVVDLEGSGFAGKASQMNATATRSEPGTPLEVRFNQDVGESMTSALNEIQKLLSVRYGRWPEGYDVEVAFEERYSPKDGSSAAVACALLVDSLVTGDKLDPGFAVTGDLNADGAVQPVGAVAAKIRAAALRGCDVVGIPEANAAVVPDMLLIEGPGLLCDVQVFALKTFDEARGLAFSERPEGIAGGVEAFAEVQGVLAGKSRAEVASLLRHPAVQERLRGVVAQCPHHLSARYLLLTGLGRKPAHLSLGGSLQALDEAAASVLAAARSGQYASGSALKPDRIGDALSDLKRLRRHLDRRIYPYADALQDFGTELRRLTLDPPRTDRERAVAIETLKRAAGRIDAEAEAIRRNREIMEQLL